MTNNLGGIYNTGTLSVAAGGTTFTGTGTLWSTQAEQGDWIFANGNIAVLDATTPTDTSLHSQLPWTGGALTNVSYALIKMSWLRYEPAILQQKVRELLAGMAATGTFNFVAGDAPDAGLGTDGQWALKVNAIPWKAWHKETGVWVQYAGPGNEFVHIIEGDSFSNPAALGLWVLYLEKYFAFFGQGTKYHYAVDGQTAATVQGLQPARANAIPLNTGQQAAVSILLGSNDLGGGAAASTIYNSYLKPIWAAYKARGIFVTVWTIPMRGDGPTVNTQRVALNALIRSDQSLFDQLMEPDLWFLNVNDLSVFTATSHLTSASNFYMARKYSAALLGVEPIPAAPHDSFSTNLIMNSGLGISQRNAANAVTGVTGSVSVWAADGFMIQNAGSQVLSIQQLTDAPPRIPRSIRVLVTTGNASLGGGDRVWIRIPVESPKTYKLGFGTIFYKWITLGFFTKIHRIGPYSGTILNENADRSYPFSFTQNVADAWEFKTIQIPGDMAGTWTGNTPGHCGLIAYIVMAAGSSLATQPANAWFGGLSVGVAGTTNGIAASTDSFQLSAFVMLPYKATLLADRIPDIIRPDRLELPECQTQFCSDFPLGVAPANNTQNRQTIVSAWGTNSLMSPRIEFPQEMAGTPTIVPYSSLQAPNTADQWQFFNGSWASGTSTAGNVFTGDTKGFQMAFSGTATAGASYLARGSWAAQFVL